MAKQRERGLNETEAPARARLVKSKEGRKRKICGPLVLSSGVWPGLAVQKRPAHARGRQAPARALRAASAPAPRHAPPRRSAAAVRATAAGL